MIKRSYILTLVMLMIFSLASMSTFGFNDMPDDWSTEALEKAILNGLLKGDDDLIRPNDSITRAEVATIMNRAFGSKAKADISTYYDVGTKDWFYDEMAKAVHMEIFQGNKHKLSPNDPITREEAFIVIARALKLEDADNSIREFTDKDKISSWAKGKVFAMVNNGYVEGANGNINPKGNITRAEFAQVMHNIVKNYITTSGTKTVNHEGNLLIRTSEVTLEDSYISGDLIIGDGVGDGDIDLENVEIKGRLLVRGGGENSINIRGNSKFGATTIGRLGGRVRLNAEPSSDTGDVILNGNDDGIFKGNYNIVDVIPDDVRAIFINANVNNVNVSGENSGTDIDEDSEIKELNINNKNNKVNIKGKVDKVNTSDFSENTEINTDKDSDIGELNINSKNSKVNIKGKVDKINSSENSENLEVDVDDDGEVDEINSKGRNTKVTGDGKVKEVNADGDDTEVDTEGTKVNAGKDAKGVEADGKDVNSGDSVETDDGRSNISSSSSSSSRSSYTSDNSTKLYYKPTSIGMPTVDIKVDINGKVNEFTLLFDGEELASTTDGEVTVASLVLEDLSRVKILYNGTEYSDLSKLQW